MDNLYYDFNLLGDYIDALMPKLRIAVIYGGDSKEAGSVLYSTYNTRSWKSYKTVASEIKTSLEQIGFKNVFLFPDNMELTKNLKDNRIHMVWLNTGGVQGDNPMCHTAALLEMLGIPYVGHSPMNYTILDNKHVFKYFSKGIGINTAPFVTWDMSKGLFIPERNNLFKSVFKDYDGPFIAKPISGRASNHVLFVKSGFELQEAISEIFAATQNIVLIEKYLPGREYCVAVSGNVKYRAGSFVKMSKPFVFSEIERVLDEDELIFTSMDKRNITDNRAILLSDEIQSKVKYKLGEIGRWVHEAYSLNTLVRIDIREDKDGSLNVLEVNPKPDLKKPQDGVISLVCKGLEEHNMSYNDLILSIFANQMDYLLVNRKSSMQHIYNLLQKEIC
ncbi:D-alanyl-alanine synthetase [Pseudobacteroides cellulosolvens]|uniref:D-alanine--D-alanine ligase domain protein n=1 Tax=Pseudobacteroides cellulosolvens ATCC 35603 = DSM 2933 TaxID=398512 RepID=A0A0L6JI21_9FIRM|nr:D-alanyl-alanine synthetase [Pseudobacteroides cellulosolvens]KNY25343.1 D-alanine--D-alanine ligase domain protein [Pseudobacteroides cellulosolvens ATCC 35603 = DSM 2933]